MNVKFAKFVLLINLLVPAGLLAWDGFHHRLGADPGHFALLTTGLLAVICLTLSLAITPLRRLTGFNDLTIFRRNLGLFGFYYAAGHLVIYIISDQGGSVAHAFSEIVNRYYLLIGFASLLLMAPLALTSTNGMIRRLGASRWKALHRLAYLAAILAVVHYYLQAKADHRLPIAFMVVLGVLLAYRLTDHYVGLRRAAAAAAALGAGRPQNGANVPVAMARFWRGTLKVAQIFQETPFVRTFRLVPPEGGALPFTFKPGQYLNLALTIDGKRVNRSYTIASSPSTNTYVEITVKREEMGVGSGHLHASVMPGELLAVSAPSGRFTFTGSEASGIVLLGAGVGITPLMSVIRYLCDTSWTGPIDLVYASRTQDQIIFREELDYLARRHSNLHVHHTLTRATDDWTGHTGRLSAELLNRLVPEIKSRRVHLCGPSAMLEPTLALLDELKVPREQVMYEVFTSPTASSAGMLDAGAPSPMNADAMVMSASASDEPSADAPPASVTFARSKKTVSAPSGQNVLETAESAGVDIHYDCRSGICGQCKIKLLSGAVSMEVQDALDRADRANNLILACQAKPLEDIAVEA